MVAQELIKEYKAHLQAEEKLQKRILIFRKLLINETKLLGKQENYDEVAFIEEMLGFAGVEGYEFS